MANTTYNHVNHTITLTRHTARLSNGIANTTYNHVNYTITLTRHIARHWTVKRHSQHHLKPCQLHHYPNQTHKHLTV